MSQRLGQGRENSKAFLKANPDMTAKIEVAIRQNSGLIAEQISSQARPSATPTARSRTTPRRRETFASLRVA